MTNKVKWSVGDTIKLISLVEEAESIYNTAHPNYTKKRIRMELFERIAREMGEGFTSKDCSAKWNILKTQLNAEYRKMEASKNPGSEASEIYNPRVYWWDHMQFLLGYMKADESNGNMSVLVTPDIYTQSGHDYVENIECPMPSKKRKVDDAEKIMEASLRALATLTTTIEEKCIKDRYHVFAQFVESELLNIDSIDRPTAERCKREIQKILLDGANTVAVLNFDLQHPNE